MAKASKQSGSVVNDLMQGISPGHRKNDQVAAKKAVPKKAAKKAAPKKAAKKAAPKKAAKKAAPKKAAK